jgi:KaiC/GvpD/RAD55 family RecA-like ATPase
MLDQLNPLLNLLTNYLTALTMTDIGELKKKVSLVNLVSSRTRLEKRGSKWWACCPLHNERTPSFEIQLKNGTEVFHCHGCGAGGDALSFIEQSEKLSKSDAVERLKKLAGNREYIENAEKVEQTFHDLSRSGQPKQTIPLVKWAAAEAALQRNPEVLTWLKDVRGITAETAKKIHLGYDNKGHILFPRIQSDKILSIKYRAVKDKSFFYAANMDARSLFNIDTISDFDSVFVTEGEFDTAILEQCGYCAVSLPSAGVNILPDARKALKQASRIYLAGDNDGGVGNAYMKKLARELGQNTYIVVWEGAKDANEFFLKVCGGDRKVFREKLEKLCEIAEKTPVDGFVSVLERLRTTQGTDIQNDPTRLHFPWKAVDEMNYNPRGSVVIVFSTYSGTGKTVLATQVAMHEAKRGETVVVFSPELRDDNYLALLAAQWLGAQREGGLDRAGKITAEEYRQTAEILEMTYSAEDGGPKEPRPIQYYVGFSLPETDTDKIIDFIEFTIMVTGATRFVIDTLHRIISATGKESTTELEGRIVKRLEALGIKYGTIFIVIGQSNKEAEGVRERGKNEYGVLRGSKELKDVAYGVYLLHRPLLPRTQSETILDDKAEFVLQKDRGRGPGPSTVPMLYRRDSSRFVMRDVFNRPEVDAAPQIEESIF